MIRILFVTAVLFLSFATADAQTAKSLFYKSDSLQVTEIVSADAAQMSDLLGHAGPAVENSHMAVRLMSDDSGAIDVYSKNGRGMELLDYLWYPTAGQQDTLYVGVDGYDVANTLGLGGIALWDGENVIPLKATEGRTARVGETKKGTFAEVISYGVPYLDGTVDVSLRVDVVVKKREAVVTATEISGRQIQFVTGINYHPGQKVTYTEEYVSVWGPHPATESGKTFAIGAGMFYSVKTFPVLEKTEDMVRLVSRPADQVKTRILSASSKEAELNSARRFEAYMQK